MRDVGGFRMGPFELMELTGPRRHAARLGADLQQFFQEPRYRPNLIMRSRYEAGVLGRKIEEGLLRLRRRDEGRSCRPSAGAAGSAPGERLGEPGRAAGARRAHELAAEAGRRARSRAPSPAPKRSCLVTPIGEDATTCAVEQGLDPKRTVAVDTLFPMVKRRTIMGTPLTDPRLSRRRARAARLRRRAGDGMPRQPGLHRAAHRRHDREHRLLDRAKPHRAARRHRQGGDAGPQLSERPVQVRRRARRPSAFTRCSPRCIVSTAIRATGPISGSRARAQARAYPC